MDLLIYKYIILYCSFLIFFIVFSQVSTNFAIIVPIDFGLREKICVVQHTERITIHTYQEVFLQSCQFLWLFYQQSIQTQLQHPH